MSKTFTLNEAAAAARMPAKTLHTWISRGIIEPGVNLGRGRGKGYRFSAPEVLGICRIKRTRHAKPHHLWPAQP